jgi:hypothetical protein
MCPGMLKRVRAEGNGGGGERGREEKEEGEEKEEKKEEVVSNIRIPLGTK